MFEVVKSSYETEKFRCNNYSQYLRYGLYRLNWHTERRESIDEEEDNSRGNIVIVFDEYETDFRGMQPNRLLLYEQKKGPFTMIQFYR